MGKDKSDSHFCKHCGKTILGKIDKAKADEKQSQLDAFG